MDPPADARSGTTNDEEPEEEEEEEEEEDLNAVCAKHVNDYLRSATFQNQVLWSLIAQRRQAVKQVEIVDLIIKPPLPPDQGRFQERVWDQPVVLSISSNTTFADLGQTYGR